MIKKNLIITSFEEVEKKVKILDIAPIEALALISTNEPQRL